MKNKLTSEEQLLREKLNNASFSYQEAHWAELNQQIGSTGFMAKYGTFLKASLGLLILAISVVAINQYEGEEKLNSPQPVEESTTIEQPSEKPIKGSTEPAELITNESIEEDPLTSTNSNEVKKTNDAIPIASEQKSDLELDTEDATTTNEGVAEPETTEDYSSFEILKPELLSAACIDNEIKAIAKFKGKTSKDFKFKWFLNGEAIPGRLMSTTFNIATAGDYKLTIKGYYNNTLLSESSKQFTIQPKIELDFIANDLKDPFHDLDVQLNALAGNTDQLSWYVGKAEDGVKSGKEISWSFDKEGIYKVTLSHQSAAGCISNISKNVQVMTDYQPAFPEIFTPNNDNINETFNVKAFSVLQNIKYKMQIYALDNKLVYETNSPLEEDGWNGRLNNKGNLLAAKKYAYVIQIENEEGIKKTYTGKFQMIVR